MAKSRSQQQQQPSRWAKQQPMAQGRKGGYMSDRNMDFNKNQSIEELTGGRIKKSK